MKIENPPEIEFIPELVETCVSQEFAAFLAVSDEKYFYWTELKYRQNLPT